MVSKSKLEEVLPHLTYIKIIYQPVKKDTLKLWCQRVIFDRVVQKIKDMVEIKKRNNPSVTIGLQMVLMLEYADQDTTGKTW